MAWRGGSVLGITALLAVFAGCASAPAGAPRVMKEGDFKMLAGHWTGSAYVQQAAPEAIEGVIQETGAFYTIPRGVAGSQRPGMMRIVNGGVVYETATSKGTMTFHESDTGWVWKWQGTTTTGSAVTSELTKPK